MRKLKLEIDDLAVLSFETGEGLGQKGTVLGHKLPPPSEFTCDAMCMHTRDGAYTCAYTCDCTWGDMCASQMTDACGGCEPADPY